MIKVYGTSAEIAGSAAAKPSSAGKTSGWFQSRNVGLGDLPTTVYAWFMNMIQDEILSALTACGITPSASSDAQLGACFATKANLPVATSCHRMIPACAANGTHIIDSTSSTVFVDPWVLTNVSGGGRQYWIRSSNYVAGWDGTAQEMFLVYPVILPPGVTIKQWELVVLDGATGKLHVQLEKLAVLTGTVTVIGTEISNSTTSAYELLSQSLSSVTAVHEEYRLVARIKVSEAQNARFSSCMITYEQAANIM